MGKVKAVVLENAKHCAKPARRTTHDTRHATRDMHVTPVVLEAYSSSSHSNSKNIFGS